MNNYYLDIASHSLNKMNEELCGDQVQVFKEDKNAIIILSDGLGSGVKANILATLTTKIAMTMLKEDQGLEETISTIMNTLPVCNIRKIAYSTFSILTIQDYNKCVLIEYGNPNAFIKEKDFIREIDKKVRIYSDKKVKYSTFTLNEDTVVTLTSDGVIHAGVGKELNHGWEWKHVAKFLKKQKIKSAEIYNKNLIQMCNNLYQGLPGDDTSAVSVHLTKKREINIFIGPPKDKDLDKEYANILKRKKGLKIVCGGTTAQIISRELNKELITSFDYINEKVPPIAKIDGIDLVTEGFLTLKESYKKLKLYNKKNDKDISLDKEDGATLLLNKLIDKGNILNFYIGKAINPIYQKTDIPFEISVKHNIIKKIISELKKLDKEINIKYF